MKEKEKKQEKTDVEIRKINDTGLEKSELLYNLDVKTLNLNFGKICENVDQSEKADHSEENADQNGKTDQTRKVDQNSKTEEKVKSDKGEKVAQIVKKDLSEKTDQIENVEKMKK